MRRRTLAISLFTVGITCAAAPALATGPAALGFGANTYAYQADYGEPGLAIGPSSEIYVTTPGDNGAVLATSTDQGATWTKLPTARSTATQAALKGGDSDVAIADDGTVFAADLNVDGITVFRSTDHARTFPHQVFVNSTSDREWLAVDGPHGEDVYLAWHEIATGTMLVAISHDRGDTFSAPKPIYSNPDTAGESAHNGTSIGNITTDGANR